MSAKLSPRRLAQLLRRFEGESYQSTRRARRAYRPANKRAIA